MAHRLLCQIFALQQCFAVVAAYRSVDADGGGYVDKVGLADAAANPSRFRLRGAGEAPTFFFDHVAPSFFVIGAQKSGTSALWNLIKQHPQFVPPTQKETLFFVQDCHQMTCSKPGHLAQGEDFDKTQVCGDLTLASPLMEKYAKFYAKKSDKASWAGLVTGEVSATYLGGSCAIDTMHGVFPQAKLIALLREPVARAMSRFKEQAKLPDRYWSDTFDDFTNYVTRRLPTISKCLDDAGTDLTARVTCAQDDTVIGWSMYNIFLQNWLRKYGKEQLLVALTEDLRSRPEVVMRDITAHLGLRPFEYHDLHAKYNAGDCGYGWNDKCKGKKKKAHKEPTTLSPEAAAAVEKLRSFYAKQVLPAMQELFPTHDFTSWAAGK